MTKRIFRSIFFAAFCVLLASLAIITGCLYEYYSNTFENQMRDELDLAAAAVNISGSGYLESINTDRFRLTLIGADGDVIYDTREDADTLANHADRGNKTGSRNRRGTRHALLLHPAQKDDIYRKEACRRQCSADIVEPRDHRRACL